MNHPQAQCRDYLLGLPGALPPPALRQRVLEQLAVGTAGTARRTTATHARSRRRRWPLALAAALGTAALALGLAMGPLGGQRAGAPAASPMVTAQALEQRVLATGLAPAAAPRSAVEDIDRALGDAYRRQAADEELDALWRARAQALDAMDKGLAAAPVLPARI